MIDVIRTECRKANKKRKKCHVSSVACATEQRGGEPCSKLTKLTGSFVHKLSAKKIHSLLLNVNKFSTEKVKLKTLSWHTLKKTFFFYFYNAKLYFLQNNGLSCQGKILTAF